MLHKTSLTDVSTFSNRGTSRLLFVAAVLGLTVLCEPELNAAPPTTVVYLQQIPVRNGRQTSLQIPLYPTQLNLGSCPPQSVASTQCLFGPFALSGYGNSVYVSFSSISGDLPAFAWGHQKAAEVQSTSNTSYNWGADTNFLSLENKGATSVEYTVSFYFDGLTAPNPADLFLVVAGLASGTTVKLLSPQTGHNAGEFTFPPYKGYSGSSPTVAASASAWTFSGHPSGGSDPYNTGWDLYQPDSPNLRVLSLDVNQQPGDGIGLTLGYRGCTTLFGNTFFAAGGLPHLYDINTATGAATNPIPINGEWSLAFSAPISPEGTLYALAERTGFYPGGLFTVDPSTGLETLVPNSIGNLYLGGLAADPTTGILYAIDRLGNLSTINGGVLTPVGPVTGSSYVAAMAFDKSGDLFIVDAYSSSLLKVLAPVTAARAAAATSHTLSPTPPLPAGALAIDPWTGKAYYSAAGNLYTLDLTNFTLTLLGPTGTFAPLAGLAFTESPLPKSGACPIGN